MSLITPISVATADVVKVEAVQWPVGCSQPTPIRNDARGVVTSEASRLHRLRQCRPCAHSWKPGGCFKGQFCEFCHLCDEKDFRRFQRSKMVNRNKANTRNAWWHAQQEPKWNASWHQLGDWSYLTDDSEFSFAREAEALHVPTTPSFTLPTSPLASTRSRMTSSSGDSNLVLASSNATWPPSCEPESPLLPTEEKTALVLPTMTHTSPEIDDASTDSSTASSHGTSPFEGKSLVPEAAAMHLRIKNTFLDFDTKEDVGACEDPKHKRSSSCPAVLQQADEPVDGGLPLRSTAWIPLHKSLATWSSEGEEVPDAHCSDIVWCHSSSAAAVTEEQWLNEIVSMPL